MRGSKSHKRHFISLKTTAEKKLAIDLRFWFVFGIQTFFSLFQHFFFREKVSRQIVGVDKVRQTHDFFLICLLDCVGFHMYHIVVFSPSVIFQNFLSKKLHFSLKYYFSSDSQPIVTPCLC